MGCGAVLGVSKVTPAKPATVTRAPSDAMRYRQRNAPDKWVLTISDWHGVLNHMKTLARYVAIKSEKRFVNMHDATREFVTPWSMGTGCGLALLMTGDQEHSAEVMLSHSWGEDIEEMQDAVRSAAEVRHIPPESYLWFCCFANYQANDSCGPSVQDQVDMKPFKIVVHTVQRAFGMIAVHTTKDDLYSRLWCVHEIDEATRVKEGHDANISAAFSQTYIDDVSGRCLRFFERGFDDEGCQRAAGIGADTIRARCSRAEDERVLVSAIMEHGGFVQLDATISQFRLKHLPSRVEFILIAAKLNSTKSDVVRQGLESLTKLRGVDMDIRRAAAGALGAVLARLEHVGYADEDVRRDAVEALGWICIQGDGRAMDELLENLEHSNVLVRSAALHAMARVCERGDERAISISLKRLEDSNASVREAASKALAWACNKGDHRAIQSLSDMMQDGDKDVCQAVVDSLVRVCVKGDEHVVDMLLVKLEHSSPNVRQAAGLALSRICEIGDERAIADLLAKLDHQNAGVRAVASSALAHVCKKGDERAISCLLAKTKDSNASVCGTAAQSLPLLVEKDDPRVIGILLAMLEHGGIMLSATAADSLAQVCEKRTEHVVDRLLVLMEHPSDRTVSRTAEQALMQEPFASLLDIVPGNGLMGPIIKKKCIEG